MVIKRADEAYVISTSAPPTCPFGLLPTAQMCEKGSKEAWQRLYPEETRITGLQPQQPVLPQQRP